MRNDVVSHRGGVTSPAALLMGAGVAMAIGILPGVLPGDSTDNDGGASVHGGSGSTAVNSSTGGGSATLTATQPRTETSTRTSTVTAPRTDDHTVTNSYNRTARHDSHDTDTDTHIPGP
jgi:hypothetical protein